MIRYLAITALALLMLGASCGPKPPSVMPGTGGYPAVGGTGPVAGAPAVDGYAKCAAAVELDPGTLNVIHYSGEGIAAAVVRICSDPELQSCYAEGRCK